MLEELLLQAAKALGFYTALILILRLAGKRMAGQTSTLDLIVLITLAVVIQNSALQKGWNNAVVFVVIVFAVHMGIAALCARSTRFRHWVRGKPRVLVRDGKVIENALRREAMTLAELHAGLRKLDYDSPAMVKLSVLEETGHISAVAADNSSNDSSR